MAQDNDDQKQNLPTWYIKAQQKAQQNQIEKIEEPPGDYVQKAQRLFRLALSRQAKSTVETYQHALSHFATYLNIDEPAEALGYILSLPRIDAQTKVLEYLAKMEQDGLSPSTIRSRLSAIKFYVSTAHSVDWVGWELSIKGPPQEAVKNVEGPTPQEFAKILEVIEPADNFVRSRNKLLIYMLSFMGLRISEALGLDLEHVDLQNKRIFVLRKGKKVQRVWRTVPTETMMLIEDYLELRGEQAGALFLSAPREGDQPRLSRFGAYKMVKRLGKKVGMQNLHPHAFRHFSVTQALEVTDGNEHKVMRHSGHTTRKMIDVYDDQRKDEAGEVAKSIEEKWTKK